MLLTAVDSAPSEKDTVLAIVAASAALAGLVLVFLGVLVTTYQQLLGPDTSDRALGKIKRAAIVSLVAFGFSLVSVVMDAGWILWGLDRFRRGVQATPSQP